MVIQSSADDVPLQEDGPAESPTLLQYHSRCFSIFYVGTHDLSPGQTCLHYRTGEYR